MIKRYSREEISKIWSDENKYQVWLDLELAVCEAWAQKGKIPAASLENIKSKANFNIPRIEELDRELHHDVIAFLTCVGEHIDAVENPPENSQVRGLQSDENRSLLDVNEDSRSKRNEAIGDLHKDSRFVHMGMTSSDLIDTSFSIMLGQSGDHVLKELDSFLEILKRRALEHRGTICMGRSHGIHAEPTTFGLKLLSYYDELSRARKLLTQVNDEMKVCMISGAVGTYANIDPEIEKIVAERLGLKQVGVSSQVIGRDRHAAFFSTLAQIASSIERIAVEIRHLQRTEVLEVEEPFVQGQKGSSAMPHKRNPWRSENLSGLARMVRASSQVALENIALWHERDISHSSTERTFLPDAIILTDFMIDRIRWIIDGLNVYPENMKRNMNRFGGVSFSQQVLLKLIDKGLKREDAYKLVQGLAHEAFNHYDGNDQEVSFRKLLESSDEIARHLNSDEIAECFDTDYHLKNIGQIFDRVLESLLI